MIVRDAWHDDAIVILDRKTRKPIATYRATDRISGQCRICYAGNRKVLVSLTMPCTVTSRPIANLSPGDHSHDVTPPYRPGWSGPSDGSYRSHGKV